MSSALIKSDDQYRSWIQDVSKRFRQSQIKAAVHVNAEMLRFYWTLGRDMESMKGTSPWGSHFYEQISRDLQEELPDIKSFSPRNLLYMHQFYRLFSGKSITPQVGAQLTESGITPQVDAQLNDNQVFCIPWGHLKLLIDKCGDNLQKALFYVRNTIENNWSRAVLLNQLDMDLIK